MGCHYNCTHIIFGLFIHFNLSHNLSFLLHTSCSGFVKEFLALNHSKQLTHRADHVGCGPLIFRKPECCHLGWGENDEGLSQGTKSLTQHHHCVRDLQTADARFAQEAHYSSEHVQPGAQDQLQGQDDGDQSDVNMNVCFYLSLELKSCNNSAL